MNVGTSSRVTHRRSKACAVRGSITLVAFKKDPPVSLFLRALSAPILRRCSYARREQHLALKPERGCRAHRRALREFAYKLEAIRGMRGGE